MTKRFFSVKKGFSIIELMIVVAIIGIIASIAVPAYHEHMVRARLATPVQALIATSKIAREQFDEYGGSFANVTQNGLTFPSVGFLGYNTATSGGIALQIYAQISDPKYPEINGKWMHLILTSHGSGASATMSTCCGAKTQSYYGTNNSPSVNFMPSGCNSSCDFPY